MGTAAGVDGAFAVAWMLLLATGRLNADAP